MDRPRTSDSKMILPCLYAHAFRMYNLYIKCGWLIHNKRKTHQYNIPGTDIFCTWNEFLKKSLKVMCAYCDILARIIETYTIVPTPIDSRTGLSEVFHASFSATLYLKC